MAIAESEHHRERRGDGLNRGHVGRTAPCHVQNPASHPAAASSNPELPGELWALGIILGFQHRNVGHVIQECHLPLYQATQGEGGERVAGKRKRTQQ